MGRGGCRRRDTWGGEGAGRDTWGGEGVGGGTHGEGRVQEGTHGEGTYGRGTYREGIKMGHMGRTYGRGRRGHMGRGTCRKDIGARQRGARIENRGLYMGRTCHFVHPPLSPLWRGGVPSAPHRCPPEPRAFSPRYDVVVVVRGGRVWPNRYWW